MNVLQNVCFLYNCARSYRFYVLENEEDREIIIIHVYTKISSELVTEQRWEMTRPGDSNCLLPSVFRK